MRGANSSRDSCRGKRDVIGTPGEEGGMTERREVHDHLTIPSVLPAEKLIEVISGSIQMMFLYPGIPGLGRGSGFSISLDGPQCVGPRSFPVQLPLSK